MIMLKEKLTEALENKENDVNSYVWKYAKKDNKPDVKLMDMDASELQKCYDHCNSMLYSTNKKNPGRFVLKNIINKYREKCNIELLLRYMEDVRNFSDGRSFPRHLYYETLSSLVDNEGNPISKEQLKNIPISAVTPGLPREFENIPISEVLKGCLDDLGVISFSHITFNFILSLGVYFTPDESKALTMRDENGKKIPKMEIVKRNLKINPNTIIKSNPKGLTYSELSAIWELKTKSKQFPLKVSSFTTEQLLLLRNKLLFKFEQELNKHIEFWEKLVRQIEKVAEVREIILTKENV